MSKEFFLALKKRELVPKAKKVIDAIEGWDYRYDKESTKAVLFEVYMIQIAQLV